MKHIKKYLATLLIVITALIAGYLGIDPQEEAGFTNDLQKVSQAEMELLEEDPFLEDEEEVFFEEKEDSMKPMDSVDGEVEAPLSGLVEEDGTYTSKEDVAAYIHDFGHLPSNYITKKEAKKLGWDSKAGNLDEVAPGKSIGGDHFGNYDKMLPIEDGRTYQECDIDFEGGHRNAKRIIYSNDGLIFYTDDHYETFTQLY